MKNLLLVFIVLLFSQYSTLFSQEVKLSLSDEIKIEKKKLMTGLLRADDTGYYMAFDSPYWFFNQRQDLSLAKYDKNLKEVYFKRFEMNEKGVLSHGISAIDNKFVWLQSKADRKAKTVTYYMTEISLEGKAQKPKKIAKVKYERWSSMPTVKWEVDNEFNNILLFVEVDRDARKDNYQAYFSVIDSNFSTLWKKTVKLKESQLQVDLSQFVLSANNEVFATARIFDSNKSAGKLSQMLSKDAGYDSYVLRINEEGVKRFKLKVGDKFIKGFRIEESNYDDSMVCVAMTGDSRNGPIQGMSYFGLNPESGAVEFSKNRKFTDAELEKFGRKNTSKDRRSAEKGLDDEFRFREIIYKEDGSFLIVAEEYQVRIRTSVDANGNRNTTSTFINNHIMIAESDKEGNISDITLIPKKYKATKSGYPTTPIYEEKTHYMFYSTLNNGERVYFLYNDDEKNLKRNITDPDKYKTVTNFRECVAVISHVDENGEIQKKELFSREDTGTLLMPKFSVGISDTELFVFLKRRRLLGKNVFRFGILEVKD